MTEERLSEYTRQDYQIDNFTKFIKDTGFKFLPKAIHIAGTNGKGSCAHYLYSIYRAAGLKVGLFTSPFAKEINEMVVVNDTQIPDEEIENYLKKYEKQFKKHNLSKFEVETFIAFCYFNDQNLDLAIIECGMGGEEDATNIFTPILSIITTISLEHTEQLGTSTAEIALAKAGIIKDEIPVLVGYLEEIDLDVIYGEAHRHNSKLVTTSRCSFEELDDNGYKFTYLPYRDLRINNLSHYSVEDACIAIEATNILQDTIPVTASQISQGLLDMTLPYRMDIVSRHPLVIIDGAHNVDGMKKTCNSIENIAKGRPIHAIFACFRDKNLEGLLTELNYISQDITLTTFDHPRAREEDDYFLYLEDYPFVLDYHQAIETKIEEYPDDVILICGSLAFSSVVKELFIKDLK
ncbi:MAG: hypothetical protein LUC31_01295 [Coprobacillus sp.]|nr:hypothetical protein [Coprobacillus sp.]